MSVVFITEIGFWRTNSGAANRIASFITYCASRYKTEVIFVGYPGSGSAEVPSEWRGIPVYDICRDLAVPIWLVKIGFLPRRFFARLRKLGVFKSSSFFQQRVFFLRSRIANYLRKTGASCVIVEYLFLEWVLHPSVRRQADVLVDTHDVLSQRYQDLKKVGTEANIKISRVTEARYLRKFGGIVAIQKNEAEILRGMVPNIPVITAGVPAKLLRLRGSGAEGFRVLYCGSDNESNRVDIVTFVEEVWVPFLKDQAPSAELIIVGGVCRRIESFGKIEANIKVLGTVADLEPIYEEATMVVNPVRAGSGLKTKCVEALGYGKALLTTPAGMDGIEDGEGSAFFVYRSSKEARRLMLLAMESSHVVSDLETAAWSYAQLNLTDESVYREFDQYLKTLSLRS